MQAAAHRGVRISDSGAARRVIDIRMHSSSGVNEGLRHCLCKRLTSGTLVVSLKREL